MEAQSRRRQQDKAGEQEKWGRGEGRRMPKVGVRENQSRQLRRQRSEWEWERECEWECEWNWEWQWDEGEGCQRRKGVSLWRRGANSLRTRRRQWRESFAHFWKRAEAGAWQHGRGNVGRTIKLANECQLLLLLLLLRLGDAVCPQLLKPSYDIAQTVFSRQGMPSHGSEACWLRRAVGEWAWQYEDALW